MFIHRQTKYSLCCFVNIVFLTFVALVIVNFLFTQFLAPVLYREPDNCMKDLWKMKILRGEVQNNVIISINQKIRIHSFDTSYLISIYQTENNHSLSYCLTICLFLPL